MANNIARGVARADDITADWPSRQILAYLGAVRMLRGIPEDEETARGRMLIQRLAADSVADDYPSTKLALEECACIIDFVRLTEPDDPKNFFGHHAPNAQCGLMAVLRSVNQNIRAATDRSR
jgi:hypothetical protein